MDKHEIQKEVIDKVIDYVVDKTFAGWFEVESSEFITDLIAMIGEDDETN